MDDTDRKLLILIGENPRFHFRELAQTLRISRQAVHHRLKVLMKAGIVRGHYAGVSVAYSNAIPVAVCGRSRTASIDETLDELGGSELVRRVVVAGGNHLYVIGYLREISELDRFAEFVRRTAEMPDPLVGIYCLDDGLMPHYFVDGSARDRDDYRALTPLDLKIIAAIKDDARKPIAEVAQSIGVSNKTVRRHLTSMISEGSLELQTVVDLGSGGDLFFIMHVQLENGADKRAVGRRLLSRDYFRDQYIRTFSNIPGLLMWVFWSQDINHVRTALNETEEDADVRSVTLNFAYLERVYHTTWLDKMPGIPPKKPMPRKAKSGSGKR